jgi:ABC-type polysaccharide/polyol phosphate export permease
MTDSPLDRADASRTVRIYRPVIRRVRLPDLWGTARIARIIGTRDIRAKYKQAALGPLWLVIAPLGMLVAIVVAFSSVTHVGTGGVPYLLFALTGLTVWTFIQLCATLAGQAIVGNASLVRRSPIPRAALVTGALLGNLPPVAIMLSVTLVDAVATRGLPLQALLLPVLICWLFGFTLFLALLLAALAARFRDIVQLLPLVLQAGIFLTPVGYSLHGEPSHIRDILILNPVSGLIEAWRWSLLNISDPEWAAVAVAAGWTVVIGVLGWRAFTRLEVHFADFV